MIGAGGIDLVEGGDQERERKLGENESLEFSQRRNKNK